MTTAVASTLNIELDAASRIRTAYWRRYGATVIGMVRHHGIDARTFLRLSHQFDIASMVHSETGLARKLRQIEGRKIVFTNAPLDYARAILKTLKILHYFESDWALADMSLQGWLWPKTSTHRRRKALSRLYVTAARTK